MSTALAVLAFIVLSITFVLTLYAIWHEKGSAAQLLEFTEILVSWKVIAGGLVLGTGMTFKTQIEGALTRLFT